MGKRPAEKALVQGKHGLHSTGGIRPSIQREEQPVMETGFERIAAKARSEPKLRFTSLAHHLTGESVCGGIFVRYSSPYCSRMRWSERTGGKGEYSETGCSRCWNRCTGRDIGRRRSGGSIFRSPASGRSVHWACPVLQDRALQRSVAEVRCPPFMSRISCPARLVDDLGWSAHHALATLAMSSLPDAR